MNEPIDRAIRAVPELNALVTEVLDLSSCIGAMHSSVADDAINSAEARARDMALMYVSKQDEHLRSVRVLIEAGQHRDAWLIARTMLEGWAQLEWALCHQPEGPDEWFWYEAIEDWRQVRKNLASGGAPDDAAASVAQGILNQHGKGYYSAEARKKANLGKPIPADPYRHNMEPSRHKKHVQ